jgi:predicted peptidase
VCSSDLPLCLVLLFVGYAIMRYVYEGFGGVVDIFIWSDRSCIMQVETYEDPGGVTMEYRIYVPDTPEDNGAAEKLPLVLYLHGANDVTWNNRNDGLMQVLLKRSNREKYPCVALMPQCPDGRWWADDAMPAALMGLLEQITAAYSVDMSRIYVAGKSMGGYGAWGMLAAYSDYFAAAVPVCGGGEPETAPLFRDTPIWAFHGAKDPTVSVQGTRDMVKALEDAGAKNVKYTEYPLERHQSWELAWRNTELLPWMFAQAKGRE